MIGATDYLLELLIVSMIMNLGIALYGVFYKPNLIKKIISLTILGDTANAFALIIGYRLWLSETTPSRPPILVGYTHANKSMVEQFANTAVDPLPQALVLTAVVIGLAVTLFLVFLALQIYRHYGTLDMREVRRLRG